ncbi:DUF3068 domain-containing protein [Gordonia polyisoprenivorans]|nr:porin PorA family protein [Gordonia polyisoprenivorans]QUD82960.1 DUF3068 domain-containing protein [Gordonia polyisoprenivorans]
MLDAQALGRGDIAEAFVSNAPVTMDRTVKAVKTSGNTTVVTDNSTVNVANQTLTDDHTYSLNRTTMLPARAPTGQTAEHTDGYTVTLPIGPRGSGSSYRLNDNATQQAFPLTYRGSSKLHGRAVYEYTATATGNVKSVSLLRTLPSTLPSSVAAQLMSKLPAASQAAIKQAGQIPSAVPLAYSATTNYDLKVDKQLGAPLSVGIERTVTAYAELSGQRIELLPVLQLNVKMTDQSVASAAKTAKKSGLTLTVMSTWLPTILTVIGVLLLLWTLWREILQRRTPTAPTPDAGIPTNP